MENPLKDGKKIGGVPVAVALPVVAVVGFLVYRHFTGGSATASAATPVTPSDTSGLTTTDTGAATGAAAPGIDLSGLSDAIAAGLSQGLAGAGAGGSFGGFPDPTGGGQQPVFNFNSPDPNASPSITDGRVGTITTPPPPATIHSGAPPVPYGGVNDVTLWTGGNPSIVSSNTISHEYGTSAGRLASQSTFTTKLKNGALLYHLPSGEVVEQAPGKTPYTVKAAI